MTADIEDDIFSLTTDQNDQTGFVLDDEPPILPSQFKSNSPPKKTKKGQRRRPPGRVAPIDLDAILAYNGDSDEGGNLTNKSDKDSSPPAPKEEKKEKKIDEKKANTQDITPISKVETFLTDYVSNAISLVRRDFTEQLTKLLDNTEEEQSVINSFLLSLPALLEETTGQEIAATNNAFNKDKDSSTVISTIDSQLEPLWRVIPKDYQKLPKHASLSSLTLDVLNSKSLISTEIDKSIDELRTERHNLAMAKQQYCTISEATYSLPKNNNLRMMEIEANSRQLDIESEFIEQKKKQLEESQKNWRTTQLNNITEGDDTEASLLSKITTLANEAPQSKYAKAANEIESLLSAARQSKENIHMIRKQIEMEMENIVSLVRKPKKYTQESPHEYQDQMPQKREQRTEQVEIHFKTKNKVAEKARKKINKLKKEREELIRKKK